ncbi:hypothetical protein EDD80_102299 [Anseongella ginsenosidimutans]|uniref:ABC-2 family transporter n=1 Tax=Anseongella ginsenosidimutans TaxID=496056 RepID=A0A4R3KWK1_9SPHI|nr:ABC transporter permease [Anseongella ginsenosidimutans]QEC51743.1 hypothetical protein FRZ59_04910 [Anseongella ginsenosidimutans]TCS89106.1 hypothetical protein EDD80_102299 [Anseongella ginsenosidimutans]
MSTSTSHFGNALRAEALKSKRSFALWLTAGCSLFIPLIWMLALLFKSENLLPNVSPSPWDYLFRQAYQNSTLLLPFFIVLIVNLIVHIEHRADAWKQLYVQPVSRAHIYFSKLLFILLLTAASHLLFMAGIFLAGILSGLIVGEYNFLTSAPDFQVYFGLLFRSFIAIMGIAALQYSLSYHIKNFSIPFGIGLAGVILSVMAIRAEEIIYLPYSYPMLSLFRYEKAAGPLLADVHYYSLAWFLAFAAAGFIIARKRTV